MNILDLSMPNFSYPSVAAIILAGGKSERLGAPKVLQKFKGIPFFKRIVYSLRKAGIENIIMVLGHKADILLPHVQKEKNFSVIINEKYEEGQFSSLKAGIQTLDFSITGVLICLIDQPHLEPAVYSSILKHARGSSKKILIPTYQGQGGHPIYIPSWIFSEIISKPATITLRELIYHFTQEIVRIELNEQGILEDIDTMEDLIRLETLTNNSKDTTCCGLPS
jgi:molybdenum cofactor cytidylyltransferase